MDYHLYSEIMFLYKKVQGIIKGKKTLHLEAKLCVYAVTKHLWPTHLPPEKM